MFILYHIYIHIIYIFLTLRYAKHTHTHTHTLLYEKYLEKELCTSLITSELLRARPLMLASKL